MKADVKEAYALLESAFEHFHMARRAADTVEEEDRLQEILDELAKVAKKVENELG